MFHYLISMLLLSNHAIKTGLFAACQEKNDQLKYYLICKAGVKELNDKLKLHIHSPLFRLQKLRLTTILKTAALLNSQIAETEHLRCQLIV